MSEEQNKNNIDLGNILPSSDTKTDVKEDVSLKGASTDFLQSNNMITRFAFILGVLIIFLYLMRVLISLMGWFFNPSSSPYITKGVTDTDIRYIVNVNPNNQQSIPILRSVNARKGIEFTYSIWLYINDVKGKGNDSKYEIIFNKGELTGTNTINGLTRVAGPGLFINNSTNKLLVRMNIFNKTAINESGIYDDVVVDDIPLKKWVNVMIRCEGNMLDIFINGMIVQRKKLRGVPRQNYNNIFVTPDTPFHGHISDLRYWNKSLGTHAIYNLISAGPNLDNIKQQASTNATIPRYFSTKWFFKN